VFTGIGIATVPARREQTVDDRVEQRLHPEEVSDSVLDGRLGPFRTLRMSTRDLVQTFPNNNLIPDLLGPSGRLGPFDFAQGRLARRARPHTNRCRKTKGRAIAPGFSY
jgi:hypothetical protein